MINYFRFKNKHIVCHMNGGKSHRNSMIISSYPMTAWLVLGSDKTKKRSHNFMVKSLGTLPWVFSTQQRSTPPRHRKWGKLGVAFTFLYPLLEGWVELALNGGVGCGFYHMQGRPHLDSNPGSNPSSSCKALQCSQQQGLRHWQQPSLSGRFFTKDLLLPLVFTTLSSRHYGHFTAEETQLLINRGGPPSSTRQSASTW